MRCIVAKVLLLAALAALIFAPTPPYYCEYAQNDCMKNATCNASLSAYTNDCGTVLSGYANNCSKACLDSWNRLIADPNARNYNTCQCQEDNYYCYVYKANFFSLCEGITPPPPPKCSLPPLRPSPIICSQVFTNTCLADATCNRTYNRFVLACGPAWTESNCPMTCQNEQSNFYCDSTYDKTMRGCICGPGDVTCFKTASAIQRTCGVPPSAYQSNVYAGATCNYVPSCAILLKAFYQQCAGVNSGQTTSCSSGCKESFKALIEDPIGYNLVNVSCGNDTACQAGLSVISYYCLGKVVRVPQVCDDILAACATNPECSSLVQPYMKECDPSKVKSCTSACKAAVRPLLRDPIGARLLDCYCTSPSPENSKCTGYYAITQQCLNSTDAYVREG
ncbi:uncharacterized protein [Oscarella lobularis]|uniref:uncharacterized protein n=1 Tax=Oscarella lobularis TaxID=121494 RepID=UPI0033137717